VASPQTTNPCYYGIDTPDKEQLIAASHDEEEIREHVTADTLSYLTIGGLRKAVDAQVDGEGYSNFCEACFTGDYPIPTHTDSSTEEGEEVDDSLRSDLLEENTKAAENAPVGPPAREGQVGPPPEASASLPAGHTGESDSTLGVDGSD
jgi:hypothetical protein